VIIFYPFSVLSCGRVRMGILRGRFPGQQRGSKILTWPPDAGSGGLFLQGLFPGTQPVKNSRKGWPEGSFPLFSGVTLWCGILTIMSPGLQNPRPFPFTSFFFPPSQSRCEVFVVAFQECFRSLRPNDGPCCPYSFFYAVPVCGSKGRSWSVRVLLISGGCWFRQPPPCFFPPRGDAGRLLFLQFPLFLCFILLWMVGPVLFWLLPLGCPGEELSPRFWFLTFFSRSTPPPAVFFPFLGFLLVVSRNWRTGSRHHRADFCVSNPLFFGLSCAHRRAVLPGRFFFLFPPLFYRSIAKLSVEAFATRIPFLSFGLPFSSPVIGVTDFPFPPFPPDRDFLV